MGIRPVAFFLFASFSTFQEPPGETFELSAAHVRFRIFADGRWEALDRDAGVAWASPPGAGRFGEVTLRMEGRPRRWPLEKADIRRREGGLDLTFRPAPEVALTCRVAVLPDGRTLEFSWSAPQGTPVEGVRLLDAAFQISSEEGGYVLVPVREGLLVPAEGGKPFTHRFDTSAYEGCHMQMSGIVKSGAAALVTWEGVDAAVELRKVSAGEGRTVLSLGVDLRRPGDPLRVRLLGRGDDGAVARAYREVARSRGLLVPWEEKVKSHTLRRKLEGAVNFKLWSVLSRRMSEDSSREESVRVNWTFDQAARIAEHLSRDLRLERVLFIMGGWIRRGYDNQHPDILPAAPECGGNEALADCARRVRALGYLFGLHDNYQDMYRDSPSWDERFLMKRPDGTLAKGGRWAGGRAYLTCSKMALDLARRPQNLTAVRALTSADAYFIDTTTAAGLFECFDPEHPLTRADDLRWKTELCRYARDLFGIFGSECGREWAIPVSDFFEGFTGVSGRYYHDAKMEEKLGAVVVPLFEMVYRDCMALYGKYGYDPLNAAEYVLHHLAIGRPLHYHSVPSGLYWEVLPPDGDAGLDLRPAAAEIQAEGPRRFRIAYRWDVGRPPAGDWRVFVHFTDSQGAIRFQNDHAPHPPTSAWKRGEVVDGPFVVEIPAGLQGTFDIRVGLYRPDGGRARLRGRDDGERRYVLGKMVVGADRLAFESAPPPAPAAGGDPGLFARADGGWAEGMHPLDRFLKNTYEILSPLHAGTARMRLTVHAFLTPDRRVRRSVFGEGEDAWEVVVNGGSTDWRHVSRNGGETVLPPFGFLVDGPAFAAFHARTWGGVVYENPPLFTLTSLEGKPLSSSRRIRVFHGFGDDQIRAAGAVRRVPREAVVDAGP